VPAQTRTLPLYTIESIVCLAHPTPGSALQAHPDLHAFVLVLTTFVQGIGHINGDLEAQQRAKPNAGNEPQSGAGTHADVLEALVAVPDPAPIHKRSSMDAPHTKETRWVIQTHVMQHWEA